MKNMDKNIRVLGLESSCDETAAAVVSGDGEILSNVVLSQFEEHKAYGGVVPEIAARSHIEHMDGLIIRALAGAECDFNDLSAVAATSGPGLIGGVMVGMMTGKAIAAARNIPFIGVNHLEGHALTARMTGGMTEQIEFPYLLLLVSGGHCQILVVRGVGDYQRLGTTIDDAAGEAFDKTAKILGLGYPGGPAVEAAAKRGNETRFNLPRPLKGKPGCHFSFSGLKTAVRREVEKIGNVINQQDMYDLAASFQRALCDSIMDRMSHAMDLYLEQYPDRSHMLVVAGGVAANGVLKSSLKQLCQQKNFAMTIPPPDLCTDNGAMIAWVGVERLRRGMIDGLDIAARARWPLDPDAPSATGAGVKA